MRLALLRGTDRFGVLVSYFIGAPALQWGIEHFRCPAAGVDLVVMSKIGEAFADAEQLFVPRASSDLYVAGAAL